MRDNLAFRLVLRSLLNLVASVVLALIALTLLTAIGDLLTRSVEGLQFVRSVGGRILNSIPNGLGFLFLWACLALFIYLLLQWQMFSYVGKINETIRKISEGRLDLDHQLSVSQLNTFGVVAANVNRLSGRLRQALEDERRAEQTKNELVTNVSHDLRTPLTSILGYLGLIEQDRYRDEVELRHYVQIAYDKSQRLHELIDDLFEYTRMRHDTAALRMDPLNLSALIGELLAQYAMPLQEAGMTSRLEGGEQALIVRADAAKLVRVFENLLSNAMSYGREGKRIDVRIRVLNGWAVVEVVNYGDPISVIDLPHIFDRFYRGDKSRTQWSGGSGLGLAISKSIVVKHGGSIAAFSDTEHTVFRVSLPLAVDHTPLSYEKSP